MQTIIEQLQQLGFSQYEAQAYLALLKENPANGYELQKVPGSPVPIFTRSFRSWKIAAPFSA